MDNKRINLTPFKIFCNIAPELAKHMISSNSDLSPEGIHSYLMDCDCSISSLDELPLELQTKLKKHLISINEETLFVYIEALDVLKDLCDYQKDVLIDDPFLRQCVEGIELSNSHCDDSDSQFVSLFGEPEE